MGMQSALMRSAGAAAPVALGTLATHGSWRAAFLAMGVAPLIGRSLLGPLIVDEDRRRAERHARLRAQSSAAPT
jgi:hypothetical protein